MTVILFGQALTFEFRNGVGLDLEFTNSRLVWVVTDPEEENVEIVQFNGMLISLPFVVISYGLCYAMEEDL